MMIPSKLKDHLLFLITMFLLMGMSNAQQKVKEVADSDIKSVIEREYQFDPVLRYNGVSVSVSEGIVSLKGQVDNVLVKERATQVAETVKGVGGVLNRIKIKPLSNISATQLRKEVEQALLNDSAADAYEITVKADGNGTVTLIGNVDSWQESQIAERVAKGVRGTTEVTNMLSIQFKKSRTDSEIKPEVENTLRWDAWIDDSLIDVDVTEAKVKLSGTVGSAAEKSRAKWKAHVSGVTDVDVSDLKVRRWARDEDLRKGKYMNVSDKQIKKAVEDILLQDPRVLSFSIDAAVSNGIVTLTGNVENLKAKRAAVADAKNTVGVNFVNDRMTVKPLAVSTDSAIAATVHRNLKWDPYIEKRDVSVLVSNGVVYLSGTVDTYYERAHADDIVSRINGVVAINNTLNVSNTNYPYTYNPYYGDPYIYDYDWYDYRPRFTIKQDSQIKKEIEDELWWSPYVNEQEIDVSVKNGETTLKGEVDSWLEYYMATENAYDGGATLVINNLKVD